MTLTLSMLRCPDNVAPETRTVAGGEFSIGRGPENDWVLPDPERGLSKRHCLVAFRDGFWQIADVSTNGTFVNREGEPIGRGRVRDLRNGDRLSFGAYEIEVHLDEAAELPRYAAEPSPAARRPAGAPSGAPSEMFALDPFARPSGRDEGQPRGADPLLGRTPADDPFASGLDSGAVSLPADYDPLAPDPAEREFRGPTQPDHTPHIEDAFAPPPARSVLPDDWDREINQATAPVAVPAPPATPTRAPTAAAPAVGITEPPAPTRSAAAPPAPPASPTAADGLLAAFLRGAGLPDLHPSDPAAAMEALGAAFRAAVSGLRQAMIARAAIKGEFRIEQTIIRARGNNPLKFSADDDDALVALIGVGRHSDMDAVAAISDALRDMRLHELATVAAMQAAVRALLAEFEPAKLRQAAEHGGLSLIPRQRKADAWDAFEALHARTTQALTDDFDSVFGKAFARAYERALGDISAREPAA
ncbi:MAG TPA: type VI secretion system-associated FHA domain protein TagH [Stellaceae bacterium]|nr:type VI secretion system-associated FHA domain protein TagH [Stellaceae bacterium]